VLEGGSRGRRKTGDDAQGSINNGLARTSETFLSAFLAQNGRLFSQDVARVNILVVRLYSTFMATANPLSFNEPSQAHANAPSF
jgi:hypothetical protein